ncbi:MobQ family relaxase, partial [Escherichia coli]
VSISDSGKNTILKTSSSQALNRASRSAPERVKRKQAIPRQDNIFKRFTTLVIDFFKQKFVWAKANKSQIDLISEEHDKRIAENYVFDEVLGRSIPRAEYEKKAKFNQDNYKPTPDEINRFPSRLTKAEKADNALDNMPMISNDRNTHATKLKPSRYRDRT